MMSSSSALALAVCGLALGALGARWWGGWTEAVPRPEPDAAVAAGVAPDLFARSRGFRELLEAVRERGDELARREQALAVREAALGARAATAGAPCAGALGAVYRAMPADDAAPLLERLDDATARAVLGCLPARQAAAVLAAMPRERAVALSKALAGGA